MHLEDAHRNGASCAIRPGSAQQSTRTAKWKEAEKKWKKLVVKARAVLGQEEKQRHKTLTKEGRNAHQWFSGHASRVPVQSWKPIDTLREKEKESKKIGGETRMVFEGERCEANKNKKKKRKKEEDTLKHQQQGPNLFRAAYPRWIFSSCGTWVEIKQESPIEKQLQDPSVEQVIVSHKWKPNKEM